MRSSRRMTRLLKAASQATNNNRSSLYESTISQYATTPYTVDTVTEEESSVDTNEAIARSSNINLRNVLTTPMMSKCSYAFNKYDVNHNGSIDKHELQNALTCLGFKPTRDETLALMKSIDTNGDCSINFKEYCAIIAAQIMKTKSMTAEEEQEIVLHEAWRKLGGQDNEKASQLDMVKLDNLVSAFGLHESIPYIFKAMDETQQGRMDYEEFKQLFPQEQ